MLCFLRHSEIAPLFRVSKQLQYTARAPPAPPSVLLRAPRLRPAAAAAPAPLQAPPRTAQAPWRWRRYIPCEWGHGVKGGLRLRVRARAADAPGGGAVLRIQDAAPRAGRPGRAAAAARAARRARQARLGARGRRAGVTVARARAQARGPRCAHMGRGLCGLRRHTHTCGCRGLPVPHACVLESCSGGAQACGLRRRPRSHRRLIRRCCSAPHRALALGRMLEGTSRIRARVRSLQRLSYAAPPRALHFCDASPEPSGNSPGACGCAAAEL